MPSRPSGQVCEPQMHLRLGGETRSVSGKTMALIVSV